MFQGHRPWQRVPFRRCQIGTKKHKKSEVPLRKVRSLRHYAANATRPNLNYGPWPISSYSLILQRDGELRMVSTRATMALERELKSALRRLAVAETAAQQCRSRVRRITEAINLLTSDKVAERNSSSSNRGTRRLLFLILRGAGVPLAADDIRRRFVEIVGRTPPWSSIKKALYILRGQGMVKSAIIMDEIRWSLCPIEFEDPDDDAGHILSESYPDRM